MIVLDTHVWVWWVSGSKRLPPSIGARLAREMTEGGIRVSSISAWEVALLVERGRLELTSDVDSWIARSEALPFLRFVPVDNRIAVRSTALPEPLTRDPADRMIVGTALELGAPLATADRRLRRYPQVETVWAD